MSTQVSVHASLIERFRVHLKTEEYSPSIQHAYPTRTQHFLEYCESNALTIKTVGSCHVEAFLRRQHRAFCKRHGQSPPFAKWRWRYTSPVHLLLRLVRGRWPVPAPATVIEAFHREIVQDYDAWLRDLRGLHAETRTKRTVYALRFLTALSPRADHEALARLSVRDVDAYLKQCCKGLRRASIGDYTVCLRDFLRHLHRGGHTALDLSGTVIGPRLYEHENIPSALRPEEVKRVLEVTGEDHSPIGLRDYAVLMLLGTYGLRAAEIVKLRLEDIDWRRDVLRVRHSKTGAYSELPLLRKVGEAVLRYLQKGRPRSVHREVFLRFHAPHRPFKKGSILHCITSTRLKAAGVTPQSRKGPHAFRHARAVSLLHSGVPLKVIGDVLGHTSAAATGVYLKLATEDLRAIGLELPKGVLL
jgi:site-specific recombinase XerD